MSEVKTKDNCFNYKSLDPNFYKDFAVYINGSIKNNSKIPSNTGISGYKQDLIASVKTSFSTWLDEKLKNKKIKNISKINIDHETAIFVNTYYLPIMYIIYSFIYKKYIDEQDKRKSIMYNIHQYNLNQLLFSRQSPLIKRVNVFLYNKLNEEKKVEEEELESGTINQIIANKDILTNYLEEINKKLESEIDNLNNKNKKYTRFLQDLITYYSDLSGNINQLKNDISAAVSSSVSAPASLATQAPAAAIVETPNKNFTKIQTNIILFLIEDNEETILQIGIKPSLTDIRNIILKYTVKINDNSTNKTNYSELLKKNLSLIDNISDVKDLYQDFLKNIDNKNSKNVYFNEIIKLLNTIKILSSGLSQNNFLNLLDNIYTRINLNIESEIKYLNANIPSQLGGSNSSNKKGFQIDFNELLKKYMKEKKDTSKVIQQNLKNYKDDVTNSLKETNDKIAELPLKSKITNKNKKNETSLPGEIKKLEDTISKKKGEINILLGKLDSHVNKSKISNNLQNVNNIVLQVDQTKKAAEKVKVQNIIKELKDLKTLQDQLDDLNKRKDEISTKRIAEESEQKKLELQKILYTKTIQDIDAKITALTSTTSTKNNSVETSLRDIFNKTFNSLIELYYNLKEINLKIQFKKSSNKIYALLQTDTLYSNFLSTPSKKIKLKDLQNYFKNKNSNSKNLKFFINALTEEYNKIKDLQNSGVEQFFQNIFTLDSTLTQEINKIIEKKLNINLKGGGTVSRLSRLITKRKRKKSTQTSTTTVPFAPPLASSAVSSVPEATAPVPVAEILIPSFIVNIDDFNQSNINKISYLNTINNTITKLIDIVKINTPVNSLKNKGKTKFTKILAYTDVIKLYFAIMFFIMLELQSIDFTPISSS